MNWTDIGELAAVPIRGSRIVKTDAGCIAIFRTSETEVFATSNTCAHKGGPLNEGIVHDKKITCPLHNWVFSLETGEAQGADEGRIATYPVKVENDRLLLDIDALATATA